MKQLLAKIFARYIVYRNKQWINNPIKSQWRTLQKLIQKGSNTQFGSEHSFAKNQGLSIV